MTTPGSSTLPEYVVGIGASAGGLEALERLFEGMPPDTGMAFVTVQHLSPDFKSLMDELLARRTSMPIHRIDDGMSLEANAVYLLPPRKELIVSGGRLLLTDKDPAELSLPIDHFLRSLAQDYGRRAIAVVLSGTGSDGSRGLEEVSTAGGLVIAQTERSAKFDGMPSAARATGLVDLSLDPEDMPNALLRYRERPDIAQLVTAFEIVAADEDDLTAIFRLLRDQHGIDFSYYKLNTVVRRTERRLQLNRIDSVQNYVTRLREDPHELNSLYRDLLVGVTRFFRDEEAFDRLGEEVDELLASMEPDSEFRAWVAGCATGEEAYSIAILLDERVRASGKPIQLRVFATDVHKASLEVAGAGVYSAESIGDISPDRLATYFTQTGEGYVVNKAIRQTVVFAPHNIIKDAPFTRVDLISCRNLLIYLQPSAQKKAVSLFHFGLKTRGLLCLGPSESTGELTDEFDTVDSHWSLYRKRRDVRLATELGDPLRTAGRQLRKSGLPEIDTPRTRLSDLNLLGAYDALLETFMPPGLLIDEHHQLLHVFGDAGRFLHHHAGRVGGDLLSLMDSRVRLAITAALRQVQVNGRAVTLKALQLASTEGESRVSVTVRPVANRQSEATEFLLSFEPVCESKTDGGAALPSDAEIAEGVHVEALESELRHAKENMQALIEELETSNEELQATNEELVASNEELQSTNEELHSVNEELYTVNAEHQRKIEELTTLTNDLENLLNSTQVHKLFMDRELRIRRFTAGMGQVFHLIPDDVGRSIDGFHYRISRPGLRDELHQVLRTGEPIEDEVQDEHGTWFLLRILPYQTPLGIEGILLTLVDIQRLKQTEEALQLSDERFERAVRGSMDALWDWQVGTKEFYCSPHIWEMLGDMDSTQPPSVESLQELLHPDDATTVRDALTQHLDGDGTRPYDVTCRVRCRNGEYHWFHARGQAERDRTGRPIRMAGSIRDVTDLRQLVEDRERQVRQRDTFLATLSHELRNPLGAVAASITLLHQDESLTHQQHEVVARIERQTDHMKVLLEDLLDVARITEGKIELDCEPVLLSDVVETAAEPLGGLIASREQLLHIALPDHPIWVHGNPARLRQVIGNLLTNAVKYSPAGESIQLVVEMSDADADAPPSVVIRVIDNGVGIPDDELNRIFEPFEQSERSLDRSDGGLGLGLTLARSLIQLHGGEITAHSGGAGRGSEFAVTLPVVEAHESTNGRPRAASERAPLNAPPLSIVIVEDNEDARSSLKQLLQHGGHSVHAAADGRSGLELILSAQPDVALIDIGLPMLNGYELARKIRNHEQLNDVHLIALTGYGLPADQTAATDAGFDTHLTKPLNISSLNELLTRLSADTAGCVNPASPH